MHICLLIFDWASQAHDTVPKRQRVHAVKGGSLPCVQPVALQVFLRTLSRSVMPVLVSPVDPCLCSVWLLSRHDYGRRGAVGPTVQERACLS